MLYSADGSAGQPKYASGVGEAIQAGYEGSATGLIARGELPSIQLNPDDSKWYERLAAGATQLVTEAPFEIAGAVGGALAGGAAGSAVPVVGNAAGAVVGAGAGTFALPTAIRESYIQAYQKGEIQDAADFLGRAKLVLKATGKDAVVGGLTAGVGRAVGLGGQALGWGTKTTAGAALTAEGTTMVVTPAALEGRLPEAQDFTDAAVMLVGLKGVGMASRKLMNIYAKTGKTPIEVLADAKDDPTIREDLLTPEPAKPAGEPEQLNLFSENELPRAYKEMAAEVNKREAVPEPSKEAAEFMAKPFADVPQLPGEPVLKTHVNYNYLNTADDVKGAMSRLSEVYEADIQQATRGTVPWEQTYAEARELYQKTTGEQPPALPLENADYAKLSADLYARKQLLTSGAEQLMDLRNKYAEAKAAGLATDQMKLELLAQIDRVAQAQAAVRGSQAEVGRALNILKSTNRDKAYYDQLTDVLNGRFGVEGKALGSANFDTMVEMMGQLGSPGEALKFAEKAAKATTWEKVVEAWKAGLVSGPVTQVANIMGNTTFMATRPLVDAVAVAVGGIRRDPNRMSAVEPLARVVGNIHGTIDGAKAAFAVLKTGEALGGKSEAPRTAIEGKLGEAIRTPFRLLSSADAFFRITNERGEAYSQAVRETTKEGYNPATREFRDRVLQLVNNPTDKMQEAIDTAGVRFTFNMPLGEKGKQIQRTIRDLHLQWAVPFVQTPANVFKEMTRLTPAAPLIKEWREAFAKGGPEADKAVAELVVGTAVFTTVFSMALSGQITGQGDPDPRKRATQMASGWQPYSIKIGNTYYSYQRLQPVGTLIGMAADSAAVWDNMTPDESDKLPKIMSTAFANAITNQTFLQGITNIVNALSDPSRFGPRFVQNMTASLVPGAVGQTAQMMDPYQREVYSVLDAVQARIPGLSENLMPKRDVFGEAVAARDRMGAISPITRTVESDDKVRLEAARLGVGVSKAPDYVELPAGRDSKLGRVELTAEQKDVFATKAGQQAHQVLSAVVGTPMWDSTPDMIQRQIMDSVFQDARSYARDTALTPEQIQTEVERISAELQRRLQPK